MRNNNKVWNPKAMQLPPDEILEICKHITTKEDALPKSKVYHGTASNQVESVLKGAKNVGRGFGRQGLYRYD